MNKFLILSSILVGVFAIPPPPSEKRTETCPTPGPEGVILNQVLTVTSPTPHEVVAVMLHVVIPPGDLGLQPHTHPGPVTGYVMEGALLQQVKGGPQTIVKAGQTFFEKDGDVHVWSANALNDTTTRILVTLFGRPGEDITTFVDLGYQRESREEALKLAQSKL